MQLLLRFSYFSVGALLAVFPGYTLINNLKSYQAYKANINITVTPQPSSYFILSFIIPLILCLMGLTFLNAGVFPKKQTFYKNIALGLSATCIITLSLVHFIFLKALSETPGAEAIGVILVYLFPLLLLIPAAILLVLSPDSIIRKLIDMTFSKVKQKTEKLSYLNNR